MSNQTLLLKLNFENYQIAEGKYLTSVKLRQGISQACTVTDCAIGEMKHKRRKEIKNMPPHSRLRQKGN
jgi:hypothetical protein